MGLLPVAAIAFLSQEGSSARVLAPLRLRETRQWLPRPALMNAFFVCAFATKELVPYNALQADPSFILGLEPLQQLQFSNNRTAALLDNLFMTLTMAVFVLRHLGWSGVMLAFGVLLCPPVALPLFLSKMSASQKLK